MENQQAEIRPTELGEGVQRKGNISSELQDVVMRMYTLCRQERLNASGEFQRGKERCKWQYFSESKTMTLDFTNPGKVEKEPRFNYEDPYGHHVHAVKTDNQTHWTTACGKNVGKGWTKTEFAAVTCPDCTKVITES